MDTALHWYAFGREQHSKVGPRLVSFQHHRTIPSRPRPTPLVSSQCRDVVPAPTPCGPQPRPLTDRNLASQLATARACPRAGTPASPLHRACPAAPLAAESGHARGQDRRELPAPLPRCEPRFGRRRAAAPGAKSDGTCPRFSSWPQHLLDSNRLDRLLDRLVLELTMEDGRARRLDFGAALAHRRLEHPRQRVARGTYVCIARAAMPPVGSNLGS